MTTQYRSMISESCFRNAAHAVVYVFLTGIAMVVPVSASASDLSLPQAIEVARIASERFVDVCRDHSPSESRKLALADDRFVPYSSDQPSDHAGELHKIDSVSLSRWDLNMTLRVSEARCQIAIWPNVDGVYGVLNYNVVSWPGARFNNVEALEGGATSQRRQYRFDEWEADDHYRVLETMRFAGDSVVIGKYRRHRAATVDRVNDPRAQWGVVRDDGLPVAQKTIQDHRLLLVPPVHGGNDPVILEFHPRFYLHRHRGQESHPLYYASQNSVLLDGQELPAFETCVRARGNCAKDARRFRLVLDRESADRVLNGRQLTLYARTTWGEEFEFEFSMQGAREALDRARGLVRQQLLGELAAGRRGAAN